MMKVFRFVSLVGLVLATAGTAHADDDIVLESYTGAKPEEAAKYVKTVIEELARRGYSSGADVGSKFEAQASRPASKQGLPKTLKADVGKAQAKWSRGQFDDALQLLTPLVEAVQENQGAVVQDASLRDAYREALIVLALSRKGQGDPAGMNQAFEELARSFPNAAPGPNYGPEANRAFEAVRSGLTGKHGGRLIVRTATEMGVYVNEQLVNVGVNTSLDVASGEYRVLAKSRELSRSHRVIVPPGGEVSMTIDLGFDDAVHVGADFTGLLFANPEDRAHDESAYAAQFATAIGARSVAVVGVDSLQGHTVVVGALINLATGRDLRRATIAVDSTPPADRLQALAKFLAGDTSAPRGIDVVVNSDASGQPLDASRPGVGTASARVGVVDQPAEPGRWGGWKWITSGVAVAAIGAGTVLTVLNGHCSASVEPTSKQCPRQYQTLGAGLGALGAGVAIGGVSVYLWLTGHPSAPSRTAYIVPTTGGALAGFATQF
jgi:hypothetical protein